MQTILRNSTKFKVSINLSDVFYTILTRSIRLIICKATSKVTKDIQITCIKREVRGREQKLKITNYGNKVNQLETMDQATDLV